MPFQCLLVSFLALSSVISAAPLLVPREATLLDNPIVDNPFINGVGTLAELGKAGAFVILTQTGLASITSKVVGNVGIWPAAMTYNTGLDIKQVTASSHATSSQVKGKLWAPENTDSPSPIAAGDANAAYTSLKNQVAPQPDVYSAALDAQTFAPGIYSWTTPIVLGVGSKVFLHGGCGEVFIFQTTGEISSGADSQIILSGGVTANSIYWVGSTSLTTGARSVWQGINLLYTNVVIGTGATLIGAIFSQTEVALQMANVKPAMAGSGKAVSDVNYPNMCSINYHVIGKVPGLTPPSIGGSSTPGINGSDLDNSGIVAMPITSNSGDASNKKTAAKAAAAPK